MGFVKRVYEQAGLDTKRKGLVRQALLLHHSQLYHLLLHRQKLTWAMRRTVDAQPAANNHVGSWLIRVKPDGRPTTTQTVSAQ